MRQNLVHTVVAKSRLAILVKELDDQVFGLFRDGDLMANRVREVDRAFPDKEVHSMLVAVEEWRDADDHFVDQDTECPPIHGVVVAIANEHLRSQVLCSSAERIGQLSVGNGLGKAEISNQQIT